MREDTNNPQVQEQTDPTVANPTTSEQETNSNAQFSAFQTFIQTNLDSIKDSLKNITEIDFSSTVADTKVENSTVTDENNNPTTKEEFIVSLKNNNEVYAAIQYSFDAGTNQFNPTKVESVFNTSWEANLVYPPLEENQKLDDTVEPPEWGNISKVLKQEGYTPATVTDTFTQAKENAEECIKYLNQFKAFKDNVEYPVCVGINKDGNFYYINNVDDRLVLLLPNISGSSVKTCMILPENYYVKGFSATPNTTYKEIEDNIDINTLTNLFDIYKKAIQSSTGGNN